MRASSSAPSPDLVKPLARRAAASVLGVLMLGAVPAFSESTGFFRGAIDGEKPDSETSSRRPADSLRDTETSRPRAPGGGTTDSGARPSEPDRDYLNSRGALGQQKPMSDADRASLERLFELFKTVTRTPDGKTETIDLPAETKRRIFEHFRSLPPGGRSEDSTGKPPANSPNLGQSELGQNVHPDNTRSAVFGADTRVQVTNTTAYPFRTVGYTEGGCSGTLIGPRHVLTAGHCIYDIETNRWKNVARFWPAQNGDTSPYNVVGVSRLVSISGWTNEHRREADIGLLVLSQNIGEQIGWLGFGYQEPMPRYNVNLLGYPSDKPSFTMWHSFCPLDRVDELQLLYRCAQWPGHSGGPIFVYLPSNQSNTIYGVAAYGHLSHFPADADINLGNLATRIERVRYETIRGWLSQF